MHVRDVVEISRSGGGEPARLIEMSYRASQDGLVALVLHGISPQTVNLVLDPIVPTLPLNIPGVFYIDIGEEMRVREAVLSAETIFAATVRFRGLLRGWGVAPRMIVPVSQADRRGRGVARRIGDSRALEPPDLSRGQSGACATQAVRIPADSQTAHPDGGRRYAF
ncbi:hypothetical protein [Chelativorans xinjiangense]|uniref:hypothetical protein n=1 Tax=Chelativorans xinjiangense TaxID=2681485 RepID=UPI0013591BF0|nr:hypothetical protein [Chelativorans xinjiangense]